MAVGAAPPPMDPQQSMRREEEDPAQRPLDPRYEKQVVEITARKARAHRDRHPNKFLFLVQGDGKALRYGVGVGRPGFTWSGVKTVSEEGMAGLDAAAGNAGAAPRFAAAHGGRRKIRSARARCIWVRRSIASTAQRALTIGTNVSSGCIRMRNEDVIDLYGRVGVGARVVVI
jgi:lipoprotein-anchoring transpeptidase ErfK/SrfK